MERILLLAWLAGCSLDSRNKHSCSSSTECEPGRVCSARLCVAPCPDCFLAAAQPSLARAGDTLSLEGTFDDHVLVTFPGGVEVPAVTVGPHRALVLVPSAAGGGELQVASGGKQLTAPFRRIGFQPQPEPGGILYPQAGLARAAPHLVEPRSDFALARVDHALYAVGGLAAAGPLASLERALVNADGTVGDFAAVGATLLTPRSQLRAVRLGSYLYVIGGLDGSGRPLTQVERATVDATGVSVDFAGIPSLSVARSRPALAVIGDGLYVLGGQEVSGAGAAVERAPISPDGEIGAFVVQPSLPSPRAGSVALVTDRRLLLVAGSDGVSSLGGVLSAPIGGDGSLGAFTSEDDPPTSEDVRGLLLGQELLLAGEQGLAFAQLENGVPSPLTLLVQLSSPRSGFELDSAGNSLQLAGGNDAQGAPRGDLEWLPLGDPTVDKFVVDPQVHLTVPRDDPGAAVIGDWLYIIGGRADPSDTGLGYKSVERAPIAADGILGSFSVTGVSLRRERSAFATVILGGRLCVIDGEDNNKVGSIECAVIDGNGDLEEFATVTGLELVTQRSHMTSVVVGSDVYLFGGLNGNQDYLSSIAHTALLPDGTLEPFASAGVALPFPRILAVPVAIDGYVYLAAGRNDPQGGWSLDRMPILSGALGAPETLVTFPPKGFFPPARSMGAISGRTLFLLGGLTHGSNNTEDVSYHDQVWIVRFTNGTASVSPLGTVHLATPRSSGVAVALGNYLYVIGGETAPSNLPGASPLPVTLDSVERAELH